MSLSCDTVSQRMYSRVQASHVQSVCAGVWVCGCVCARLSGWHVVALKINVWEELYLESTLVCVCVGVCLRVFFPPFGSDSSMTCYSMLACLHTSPVLFTPKCIRSCSLGSLYRWQMITESASSSGPVLFLFVSPCRWTEDAAEVIWIKESVPLTCDVIVAVCLCALLGCCGGQDWALAGRAAVWPSSDMSGSWHHWGKHESWEGEWSKKANIVVQFQLIGMATVLSSYFVVQD